MNPPRLTLLLAIAIGTAISAASAQAQIGIYATFAADRRHQTNIFFSPPAGGNNTDTAWPYGPTIGIYDDFAHFGPLSLGVDLRGEFVRGSSYTSDAGLFGLRLAAKPPLLPIKPYIQGSVGVAHTNGPGSTTFSNNLEYRIAGGLDFTILPHIDWRVIEVGGGSLVNYTFGSGLNQTNSLYTFSSGIVVRLH